MRLAFKLVAAMSVATGVAWNDVRLGRVEAQDNAVAMKSVRGGLLAKTSHNQFEVFFYTTGARVFVQDHSGVPLDASKLSAIATFYHPNSPQPWFSRPLTGTATSLDLAIGLGNAPATGAKVAFEVSGFAEPSESKVQFTVPLEFVPQPTAPVSGVETVPRYVYAPGYYGYGYYPYTSPAVNSPPTSAYHTYASPSGHYRGDGDSVGPGHRDWTTGRTNGLAKPWLRPRD
jgi:hypothetical protein